jgi:hypothetical protein
MRCSRNMACIEMSFHFEHFFHMSCVKSSLTIRSGGPPEIRSPHLTHRFGSSPAFDSSIHFSACESAPAVLPGAADSSDLGACLINLYILYNSRSASSRGENPRTSSSSSFRRPSRTAGATVARLTPVRVSEGYPVRIHTFFFTKTLSNFDSVQIGCG